MSAVLIGILVVVCLIAFCVGGWFMLTSLTPQTAQYTHCGRCGTELESEETVICPKCRRVLTPDMRVRCGRSVIDRKRLDIGVLVVSVTLLAGGVVYYFAR